MRRFSLIVFGISVVLVLSSSSSRGADDKTAETLSKAIEKFEAETKKVRAEILDDFDKRLAAVRKKGNKTLVEKIKDEQKAFELHNLLTTNTAPGLRKRVDGQTTTIEKAYKTARAQYLKDKKKDLAAAVEKEWKELQADGLITLAPSGELWTSLFNGKDLTGWDDFGNPRPWKFVEGTLKGENKDKNGEAVWLRSRRKDFDDFHVRMEVMCSPNSSSTFTFRESDGTGGSYVMIISSGRRVTGSVDKRVKLENTPAYRLLRNVEGTNPPANEWFTLEIIARGYSITILVNGEKKVQVVDEDKASTRGSFTLGIFEKDSVIQIRKLEILPLHSSERR